VLNYGTIGVPLIVLLMPMQKIFTRNKVCV